MASPQVAQPVQYVTLTGSGAGAHPAVVRTVTGPATVDLVALSTSNAIVTSVPYVEVGGTPPSGVAYAQEITLA